MALIYVINHKSYKNIRGNKSALLNNTAFKIKITLLIRYTCRTNP